MPESVIFPPKFTLININLVLLNTNLYEIALGVDFQWIYTQWLCTKFIKEVRSFQDKRGEFFFFGYVAGQFVAGQKASESEKKLVGIYAKFGA